MVFHQGGSFSHQGGLSSVWSLVRVISHQSGLSSHGGGFSSHHGGLSSVWSLVRVISYQGDVSSERSIIRVVSSGWSVIRVVFYQDGLIRVMGGLSSG